jgi:putative membrane protein
MMTFGKTAVAVAAALALAACSRNYESPAQHANQVGQPAVGLSSEPVTYDSTGSVVAPRATTYSTPPYGTRYYAYPSGTYPNSGYYYRSYPAPAPTYYAYPSGYTVASTVSTQDAAFLQNAMSDGAAEIDLARFAYDRAYSSSVRGFARQMLDDHIRLADQLNAIAARRGVAPVAPPSGMVPADLAYRNGDDFDEAYMQYMVADHQRALSLFAEEADRGTDPEIRAAAASAIPTLEAHLDMAERVADEVD